MFSFIGLAEDGSRDMSLSAVLFTFATCSVSSACRWRRLLALVARVFVVRLSRAGPVVAGITLSTPSAAAGVMARAGRRPPCP